jgi:hypothetical protein
MDGWDGTGDQFHVDVSDFPQYDIGRRGRALDLHSARTYEPHYQMGQQGLPSHIPCRCNDCALSYLHPKPRPPMRRLSVDDRNNLYNKKILEYGSWQSHNAPLTHGDYPKETAVGGPAGIVDALSTYDFNITSPMFIWVFIFILIVFVSLYYVRALGNLEGQIHILRKRTAT